MTHPPQAQLDTAIIPIGSESRMSYCPAPNCSQPKNSPQDEVCQACGSRLALKGRYRLVRILGQGGFGATFLAADLGLPGKPACVVKQLRPSSTASGFLEMARELFSREAETLGRLGDHPQVPRLLDYFEEQRQFYLVQEFVKGHNLQQEVKRCGPFSEQRIREFLQEMLPILKHIHSKQVIHRDLKPANIIRREVDNRLILIDFGAVKNQVNAQLAGVSSDEGAFTSFAVGTPGFAPPEQMAMRPVYASDIYGLGMTCVYLLTGKSPKDMGYNPKTGVIEWQKYVRVSDLLGGVLQKMLELSVRDRYQTALEAMEALAMEPSYYETLSQGMAKVSKSRSGVMDNPSGSVEIDPSQYVSPRTAHLAQSIREYKARRGQQTVGQVSQGIGTRRRTAIADNTLGTRTQGGTRRLEAEELLSAYHQGRRDFSNYDLSRLELQDVELSEGIFRKTKLSKTNFRRANLTGANFGQARLAQANLREAKLGEVFFGSANLEGTDLRGADLSKANFQGANLKGANLCGSNLTNARITGEQLAQAKTNWSTILPSGRRSIF